MSVAEAAPPTPIPDSTPSSRSAGIYKWLRVVSFAVCIFVFGYVLVIVWRMHKNYEAVNAPGFVLDSVPYTDSVKVAVSQKLEGAKGLFQASLLAFAVLWGVILAKKGEGKLVMGDGWELTMFVVANIAFFASWFCYSEYTDVIAAIHSTEGLAYEAPEDQTIPNFRDERINSFYNWQQTLLLCAALATGVTLVSAHLFKEAATCPEPSPSSPSP